MSQNVSLIRELNELRREIKVCRTARATNAAASARGETVRM